MEHSILSSMQEERNCNRPDEDLRGYLFVTSGLGGMEWSSAKSYRDSKCVGIVAEVDYSG